MVSRMRSRIRGALQDGRGTTLEKSYMTMSKRSGETTFAVRLSELEKVKWMQWASERARLHRHLREDKVVRV